MTTRTREQLTALLTGLARNGPDLTESDAVAAAMTADELYELGRRDLGTELAGVLRGLIDAGLLPSPSAVLNALGPLIPAPDPGVQHARSEAVSFIVTSPEVPDILPQAREAFDAALEETGPPPLPAGRHARNGLQSPPGKITGVREINPVEAARLLAAFGERYPEMAEFARQHAVPPVGYPDHACEEATSFDTVLHLAPAGGPPLPLSDDDSEVRADAAERRAGFGWDVTGLTPPDEDGCPDIVRED
jgi:hypothetical protein